jgi:peptide/nickel transport system substrate-binding protein
MMKTNPKVVLVSTLIMVCLLFTSCAPAATPSAVPSAPAGETPSPLPPETAPSPTTQIKRGGVLKVLTGSSFQELDPAHNESQTDDIPIFLVYEALLKWDPDTLEPMPGLAKSWQVSEDGLTYTFELQEGVKWHNGDPLTADDVKYSVERILDPDEPTFKAGWIDSIESVDVPDSLTVVFHLKEPFSPLLSYLPWTPMIQNRSFVEANGGQTPRTMMGTGPFMFSEWIPDQVFRLEANPNYWRMGEDGQPLPYLDGIEFYVNTDSTAMMAQLLAGEVDMTATVPTSSIQSLKDDPDIVLAGPACIAYAALWMHTTTPPYDDARVRQAVAWAIDRDEIVNVGLLGAADPIHGGLLPDWHWASTHYTVYDHRDMDKARELLAEAGYADGFQTTIYTPPSDAYITVAEMSASYLREVGIEASVEVQEEGAFFDNFLSERLPIYILGSAFSGDPDEIYYMDFHTGGAYNPLSYSNPEVDRLTEEARATSDLNERKALYRQVEEIVLQESPQALVSMDHCSEALHSYVKGYVHIANDIYMGLDEVWLDR